MRYLEEDIDVLEWAEIFLPPRATTTHFLFVGETGSAKTTLLKDLMLQCLQFVGLGRDQRAVVYDPKLDMISFLSVIVPKDAIKIFHPFDPRGVAWKMWKDITTPAHAQTIANLFVPEDKQASQKFFRNAAHDLLQGVLEAFILNSLERKSRGEPPLTWTLKEVCAALCDEECMRIILGAYPDVTGRYIKLYLDRSGKDGHNDVLSEIGTHLNPLFSIAAAWDGKEADAISLTEWCDDPKGSILVLGSDDESEAALTSLNRILIGRLIQIVLKRQDITQSDPRRTWFILDEFAELENKDIAKLLKKGRSKGICVALAFQNYDDVKKGYGEETASVIFSECASKIFLRCNSATAKMSAELIGKALRWEEDYSYATGTTHGGSRAESNSSTSGWNNSSSTSGYTTNENWSDTNTYTRHRKRVERDVVRKEAFEALLLPCPENGITGYAVSSYVEGMIWKFHTDWSEFEGARAYSPTEKNFIDREDTEPGYQFLRCSKRDLERLGLIKQEKTAKGIKSPPHGELDAPKEEVNQIDHIGGGKHKIKITKRTS
jgi:hypothetical protein